MRSRPTRFTARAPVRIDFAGGYTDVQPFASDEGGAVTNVTVALYAEAEVTLGGAGIRLASRELKEEVILRAAHELRYDGRLDLLKAALNLLPVTGPVRVETRSDAPAGSGLGSSGAMDVALLAALAAAREETFEAIELAELGYALETEELKIMGGRQDQYAAALGGAHCFRFGGESVEVEPLPLDDDLRTALEGHLVLVYTGESRLSGDVHERVWRAYGAGDRRVTGALFGLRECAERAAEALRAGDFAALGRVVTENWMHEKALAGEVETRKIAELFAAARDHGALGGKALGAGGGGCVMFLSQEPAVLAAALRARGAAPLAAPLTPTGVRVTATDVADVQTERR